MLHKKPQIRARAPRSGRPYGHLIASAAALSMLLTDVGFANVVGADTQNFNPTTSGLDYVTVESSKTLDPGVINFGFFLNDAVNSLPYFQDAQGNRLTYSDSLLSADLNVGVGLLPGLDFGISAPQVLEQDVSGSGYHGQFNSNGNTQIRVNAKYRLLGEQEGGIAFQVAEGIDRIQNNPYAGSGAGPTTNLQLIFDKTVSSVAMALNLGYRIRQPGQATLDSPPITPLGDQYIASGALSYLVSPIDTKVIFEVFGSQPVNTSIDNTERVSSSAEALLGLKHDFTTNLAGHIGGGTALIHGISSPDWRAYAGLNYTLGPTFSKPPPAVVVEPVQTATTIKADPFAGPPRAKEKIVIHDILFEFDSDKVTGSSDDTLRRLAAYLNTKPVFSRLVIEGHTDSLGSDKYNMNLSQRRAATIRKILIQTYHLDGRKIEAIGRGKRVPIADNGNYQGRQLNRRVEFTIYRNLAAAPAAPIAAKAATPAPKPAAPTATSPAKKP